MASSTVLVFGPTGRVGSAAAIEARRRGATVYLAMRDTQKELKDIDEQGNEGKYIRVQADLAKPETIKQAVETSGAKTAFAYCVQAEGSMRESFKALKDAGIEHVVFLSSFTVKEPISATDTSSLISAFHAGTETALSESGLSYTAVRPAYFTSNVTWALDDIKKGEIELLYPDVVCDYLSPRDIGTVCGSIMAEPRFQKEAGSSFYLCGPELITQRDAHARIGKVIGHDIAVKEIDEEGWHEKMGRMPKPIRDSLIKALKEGPVVYEKIFEESVKNLNKYMDREPTTLEGWTEENKAVFASTRP